MKFSNTSSIPTTWPLGIDRGYTYNPIRGCKNEGCHLHPKKTRECWAAKLCNLHAKPWAVVERNYLSEQFESELPDNCNYMNETTRNEIENDFALRTIGTNYCLSENEIISNLKNFKPTWFESQFQKEFPKQQSCFFVFSQTDFAFVPWKWVKKVIDKIKQNCRERKAARLPSHIFQFLTKSKSAYLTEWLWPINCWLGITATNQPEYNERVLQMKDTNNFWYVYLEPLRGPINIISNGLPIPDWVVIGGGPDKIDPQWIRDIRDRCILLGIPFYFKQWGDMVYFENSTWLRKRDFQAMNRRQKRKGEPLYVENLIDGEKWEQFPKV
jgi:hypothetical protein